MTSLTRQITSRIAKRVQHTISRTANRIKHSLTADEGTIKAWILSIAKSEAEELDLQVIKVLAHRDDHKVVLLCESPEYGRCILKVLPRHLISGKTRGKFRNHVATVQLARDYDTGIFPSVFHIGDHFSLQEWIQGFSLKFLPEEEWRDVDFLNFLHRVHAFSRALPNAESDLTSAEIRVTAESYLRRSLGFIRYQGPKDQLVSAGRLYVDRQKIAQCINLFDDMVSGARIPRFSILGDFTAGNVVYHRPSGRLVIVDLEDITSGVLSFDCAWLLTTIARRNCPENLLIEAYQYISSAEFVANGLEARLMRVLLKILLENDLRIIRSDMDKTRRLLKVVRDDIRRDSSL